MQTFGLIGRKLTHSFSKKYFSTKFEKESIKDAHYELFELSTIDEFPKLIKKYPTLKGLNVTIPYKLEVLPFLDEVDVAAQRVGAVNVIKIEENGILKGYNSDYYGFKESLISFLKIQSFVKAQAMSALILGTGGASKAVKVALEDLQIPYLFVSRIGGGNTMTGNKALSYNELDKLTMEENLLIINTTPLGMYPQIEACPEIPYQFLTANHFLYDLVYNPETTLFMYKGLEKKAKVTSGLSMLYLQAEKSWEIWND
jgi:shikimate dehydrogenase